MSVIEAIREFIRTCPYLDEFAPVSVDWTDAAPVNYGVSPAGERVVSRYLDGSARIQYSFVLYAREMTEADLERLENNACLERFSGWIDDQSRAGALPQLGPGKYATRMECQNGFLFSMDEDGCAGLYQIQCQLYYTVLAG